MSDKTTEEAAEYYARSIPGYHAAPTANAIKKDFIAGAESLSTTIAQLREENERLKGAMLVWIDIQDRLPEYDTTVVLYCPKRDFITDPLIIQGWFQKFGGSGFFTSIYLHEDEEIDVSHWQPLPSPPTQALTPKQPKTHA